MQRNNLWIPFHVPSAKTESVRQIQVRNTPLLSYETEIKKSLNQNCGHRNVYRCLKGNPGRGAEY